MIGQAKLKIISKKIFLQIISVTEQIYIHKKQSKFIMYNTVLFKNKDIKYKLTKNIIIKFIKFIQVEQQNIIDFITFAIK